MNKKNKRLFFPVLNGNIGALHHYTKTLSNHIDSIHHAINREVLSVYREYRSGLVHDSMLDGFAMIFRTLKHRFSENREMEKVAEAFTQYKMMWVHTLGLRYPRISHMQAGQEKRVYDNREGCLIDAEHIQFGQLYGCQCNGRLILE